MYFFLLLQDKAVLGVNFDEDIIANSAMNQSEYLSILLPISVISVGIDFHWLRDWRKIFKSITKVAIAFTYLLSTVI